jgi:hypothetical protein
VGRAGGSSTFLALLIVAVAGCAPASNVGESVPASAGSATSPSAPASVICDAFAAGGPIDDLRDALIADMSGENPAVPTRDGIDGLEALAERASGDEKQDLLVFASAVNDAAIAGEGTLGWNDAFEAFYVKYAEGCGQPIAT